MRTVTGAAALALLTLGTIAATVGCEPPAPAPSEEDGGLPARAFGEGCTDTGDCESGICLAVSPERSVCSHICTSDSECPSGGSWGCIQPERFPARVCGCAASASEEVCGDGLDNDCNGRADDCRLCGGVPVPEDDPRHCGSCGNACRADQECGGGACRCPAGLSECDGRCVDLSVDESSCGACDRACPASSTCIAGECACDSSTPDRCGALCTTLLDDAANCGACGRACEAGTRCIDGDCECSDPAFPLLCAGDGCVNPSSDERHCGACGTTCVSPQQCIAGACECPIAGQIVCGGVCVDAQTDTSSCGACGRACAVGERCEAGSCRCDSGLTCGGACTPVADPRNCGACGVTCRADQRCDGVGCICVSPLSECSGACTDVRSDESNCGACGVACPADQSCNWGACACTLSGRTYCASAGACLDLRNDPANCGACGNACAAAQTCSAGVCRCPAGATTFCSATSTCVDASSDEANCGACGNECAGSQTCTSGVCRCPAGATTFCSATQTCVDANSDEANCGACGNVCPSATTCQFGSCRCPSSSQRYCAAVDACIDTSTDELNCGGCGNVCPSTTTCTSGSCRCDPGQTLCSDSVCHDLQTEETDCGFCGRTCSAGRECVGGSCWCPGPTVGTPVRVTNNIESSREPQIASNGSDVCLVWAEIATGEPYDAIWMTILDSTGARLRTDVRLSPVGTAASQPDVVWTGTEWGVIWDSYALDGSRATALFQRVAADGTLIGGVTDIAAHWGGNPGVRRAQIAWAGASGYGALAWQDSGRVTFQAIGAPNATLPLPVIVTSSSAFSTGITRDFAGAPDGTFAILFYASAGPQLQIVNSDGSITTAPITLGTLGSGALEHDGSTWLAVGKRYVTTTGVDRRIALRGPTLAQSLTMVEYTSSPSTFADHLAVATRGTSAFAVWHTRSVHTSTAHSLLAAPLRIPSTSSGTASLLSPTAPLFTTETVSPYSPVRVAWTSDTTILVVYSDTRWGQLEIYALPVTVASCM